MLQSTSGNIGIDRKTKEPSGQKANALMEATKKRGLLVGKGGLYGNVVRMAPPMLVSQEEVDRGMKVLDEALGEI